MQDMSLQSTCYPVFVPKPAQELKKANFLTLEHQEDDDDIDAILLQSSINKANRRQRRKANAQVFTMYKRKAKKIRPIKEDSLRTNRSKPGGSLTQRNDCLAYKATLPLGTRKFNKKYLIKKFSDILRGSRLIKERLDAIKIGINLLPLELELIYEMLYNRKAALVYGFKHLSRIRKDVIRL